MQADLFKLAEQEMALMQQDKMYRTPAKTLVKLANSDLYWKPQNTSPTFIPLLAVSDKISTHVALHFNGNRQKALAQAKKKFLEKCGQKVGDKNFLNRLLLTLDAIGAFEKLNAKQLQKIALAYQEKENAEAASHLKLASFGFYWELFK